MNKLIGLLVVTFVVSTGQAFAQELMVEVGGGFLSCSGPKHYEVASKDEVNKDWKPYFNWEEADKACKNSVVDGKTDWELP